MNYEEAEDYAKRLRCDSNIMKHPTDGNYHVITASFDHWQQYLTLVAEVRVAMVVTLVGPASQEKT